MKCSFLAFLAGATFSGFLAPQALAQANSPAIAPQSAPISVALDAEQTIGDLGVGCTGIGQSKNDDRWKAYPVRIEFSNPAGDLLANAVIAVSDSKGTTIATISCEGPWIMLRPAPGTYKVEAWTPGETFKHQFATFSPPTKGQRIVSVRFPAS